MALFTASTPFPVDNHVCVPINWTEEQKLIYLDDLSREAFSHRLSVVIYMALVLVVGVTGNSFAFVVYWRRFRPSTTRVFILLITIMDLMTNVFGVPLQLVTIRYAYNTFDTWMCRAYFMAIAIPTESCGLLLIFVALDRYHRICHPLKKQLTVRQAWTLSLSSIVSCFLIASLFAPMYGRHTVPTGMEGVDAVMCWVHDRYRGTEYVTVYNVLLGIAFNAGFVLMFWAYCRITWDIWMRKKVDSSSHSVVDEISHRHDAKVCKKVDSPSHSVVDEISHRHDAKVCKKVDSPSHSVVDEISYRHDAKVCKKVQKVPHHSKPASDRNLTLADSSRVHPVKAESDCRIVEATGDVTSSTATSNPWKGTAVEGDGDLVTSVQNIPTIILAHKLDCSGKQLTTNVFNGTTESPSRQASFLQRLSFTQPPSCSSPPPPSPPPQSLSTSISSLSLPSLTPSPACPTTVLHVHPLAVIQRPPHFPQCSLSTQLFPPSRSTSSSLQSTSPSATTQPLLPLHPLRRTLSTTDFVRKSTLRIDRHRDPKPFLSTVVSAPTKLVPNRSKFLRIPTSWPLIPVNKTSCVNWYNRKAAVLTMHQKIRSHTTIMMVLLTFFYVINWLPHFLVRIFTTESFNLCRNMTHCETNLNGVFFRSYFINSTVNAFIYSFCSNRFRAECRKLFKRKSTFWIK